MATTDYTVTGMSCGHCENAIRAEVQQISGVAGVEISAATGKLSVTTSGDAAVSDDAVLAAVDEAGYTAARA